MFVIDWGDVGEIKCVCGVDVMCECVCECDEGDDVCVLCVNVYGVSEFCDVCVSEVGWVCGIWCVEWARCWRR